VSHDVWLRQADSDLDAARSLSSAGFHSQAIWCASQAVEKAHKAVLVALGLQLSEKGFKELGHKTSAIAELLPAALQAPLDPTIAADVTLIEKRGLESRYPFVQKGHGAPSGPWVAPCDENASSADVLAKATNLVGWCKHRVGRALLAVAAMAPTQP
jgi:HEPN domain-containing protein